MRGGLDWEISVVVEWLSTFQRRERSRAVRAMRPGWSRLGASGTMPEVLSRANVGLSPATPQNAAGRVMEPPVCEPSAARHMPAATAAAEPLDEPPGVCWRFHGLRVGGGSIQA